MLLNVSQINAASKADAIAALKSSNISALTKHGRVSLSHRIEDSLHSQELSKILGIDSNHFYCHLGFIEEKPVPNNHRYYNSDPKAAQEVNDYIDECKKVLVVKNRYYQPFQNEPKKCNHNPNFRIKSLHFHHFTIHTPSHYLSNGFSKSYIEGVATIELDGAEMALIASARFFEEVCNIIIDDNLQITLNGETFDAFKSPLSATAISGMISSYKNRRSYYSDNIRKNFEFQFTTNELIDVQAFFKSGKETTSNIVKYIANNCKRPKFDVPGFKKIFDKLEPMAFEILPSDVELACLFFSLAQDSKRTINSVKLSGVLNSVFSDIETTDQLRKKLSGFRDTELKRKKIQKILESRKEYVHNYSVIDILMDVEQFKDKRRTILKKQTDRAFSKIMKEKQSLDFDPKKFPKLNSAVESGDIPIGIFFRKKEQYFLLNDNWILWENMLKRDYETTVKIAQEASRRSTYEKDLMSYFYFIIHELPDYLKKHAGGKWTCYPKLIESASELNPPVEDESGTARSRSALTPTVDNENKTVIVPYASLAIPGRQTTYCYSHSYHVLRKGFSFNGNTCMNDLEKELNGRDDYGLMFYTLTGSFQARGYPTFLIIFERHGSGETTVHFHRTHPCRSKEGDYNPIHNWIRVCYNWMAGNVRATDIKAQQGDLFFAKVENKDLNFERNVSDYDSHKFEKPVPFAEYEKKDKSNILGYVKVDKPVFLTHNEHDDERVPEGVYAIRQCRSWEANPRGVWTLSID